MEVVEKLLKAYENRTYVDKLKARYLIYGFFISIVAILLAIGYTIYGNLNNPGLGYSIDYKLFSLYVCSLVIIASGLFFIAYGNYSFAGHLLLACIFTLIWTTIFINETQIVARLDSIVLLVAVLSMLPLVTSHRPIYMWFYAFANVVVLVVFVYFYHARLDLSKTSIISYISDNSVAIIGVTAVAHVLFSINKRALDNAEFEISERIKAEEALKSSELFKLRIFDSSRIPIVVMDATSFQFIEFNMAAVDAYGYPSREALLGKTPLDVSAEFQYNGTPSAIKALHNINSALIDKVIVFEWRHQRPNGEQWDAEVHLMSFKSNEKLFLQFSLIDITNRKKTERSLQQSEEKYRTLMESLNEVIMMVDNDDRVLFVNKKFTEKLGYTSDEIIGKIGYEVLIPKERQIEIKESNSKRLKKVSSQYEMPFIAKDGTVIEFFVNGAPIYNNEGVTIGSIVAMIDITENVRIRRQISDSQKMLSDVINTIPVRVFWKDLNGFYLGANRPFVQDAGKSSEEELIGLTDYDLSWKAQAELYRSDDRAVIESQQSKINYEEPQTDDSGKNSWLKTSKIPLRNSVGHIYGILGIYEDITIKKQNEIELENYRNNLEKLVIERTNELAALNEELTTSNEDLHRQKVELNESLSLLKSTQDKLIEAEKMASLGILSAGVAHEINNPLNFIHNGTIALEEYIKEHYPDDIEKVDFLLKAVGTGVDRIAGIVKSMNRYSRKEELTFTQCNIQEIIENCLVLLNNKVQNHIEIKRSYLTEAPLFYGNEGQLHQAFLNILANAVQAIDDKGVVAIHIQVKSHHLEITIVDNGHGIAPENLNYIFDPFFTTKAPGEGTGLGLAITKKIIEEHKGTITCQSVLKEGTSFKISFPL